MPRAEKSIEWIQARVAMVLKTITIEDAEGNQTFKQNPDDHVQVYFQASDSAVEKLYPAQWFMRQPSELPEGRYRVVLLDKPEEEGGVVLGEHVSTHRVTTAEHGSAIA